MAVPLVISSPKRLSCLGTRPRGWPVAQCYSIPDSHRPGLVISRNWSRIGRALPVANVVTLEIACRCFLNHGLH